MTTDPSLGDLLALARRAPMPPGYELPGGASEQELGLFEARTGIRITPQLRAWLATVNGAMIGPGGLFGVRGAADPLSIERHMNIYPEWRQQGWLPIGSDGVGNYWTVTKGPEGSEGWVSFIDVHSDPGSIEYYAASNVFRFLKFVLSAELGERGWPRSCTYVLALDPELERAPAAMTAWNQP